MLNRSVDHLSTVGVFLGLIVFSALVAETGGLLDFLLGLHDPPTPPVLNFGGWRPIVGPRTRRPSPIQPLNLEFPQNRNQFFNNMGNRPRSRPFANGPFRPDVQSFQRRPSFRPSNSDFGGKDVSFDGDNRIKETSGERLQVFTKVNPTILENPIFRFDRKFN
ncbi:hypothetical protein CHUAL_002634 [Chamberlinius hualienensis]